MSWMDALYFSTETIATVGYGDFNFLDQPTWLRLWGVVMMFAGVTTTAIVVAFVADVLLSRRLTQTTNRQKVRHLRRHVVVVGLGSFGIRVASDDQSGRTRRRGDRTQRGQPLPVRRRPSSTCR